MRPLYLLFFLACNAAFACAQTPQNPDVPPVPAIETAPDSEPEIALDELIARALRNNPQLPIARENLEAARQRVRANRVLDNAILQIVPGFSGSTEARDEEIILSQPLDVFGQKRARTDVSRAEVKRAQAETNLAERALIASVKNAATDLFAAQESQSLAQTQVEVARLFRDAAARRAQLGDVPPVQAQRADLELLRVENELENVRAERLVRRAALNNLIGQTPETPLRVVFPLINEFATAPISNAENFSNPQTNSTSSTRSESAAPIVGASSQVGSDLVAQRAQLVAGSALRPDILGAQASLEARRAQVRVLERERLPQIELQARRASVSGNSSTALRAVITVPIFDFGSNKSERRALEAEARAQESQLALLRSQAATQVEQSLIRLQQQRATVRRYRDGIVPQTLDLLRKTQIGYTQGASTYLEVLEAQRTLRQVQTEYLQALIGARTSENALENALGANLPASLFGEIANSAGAPTPPNVAAPGTVPQFVPPVVPLNAPLSASADSFGAGGR